MSEDIKINAIKVDAWKNKGGGNDCYWNIAKNQLDESASAKEINELSEKILKLNMEKNPVIAQRNGVLYEGDEVIIPLKQAMDEINNRVNTKQEELKTAQEDYSATQTSYEESEQNVSDKLLLFKDAESALLNADSSAENYDELKNAYANAKEVYEYALSVQTEQKEALLNAKNNLAIKKEEISGLKTELEEAKADYADADEDNKKQLEELDDKIAQIDADILSAQNQLESKKEEIQTESQETQPDVPDEDIGNRTLDEESSGGKNGVTDEITESLEKEDSGEIADNAEEITIADKEDGQQESDSISAVTAAAEAETSDEEEIEKEEVTVEQTASLSGKQQGIKRVYVSKLAKVEDTPEADSAKEAVEEAEETAVEETAAEETAEETTDEVSDEEITVEEADTTVEQEVRGTPYTPSYTKEEAAEEAAEETTDEASDEETTVEEAAVEETAAEEAAAEETTEETAVEETTEEAAAEETTEEAAVEETAEETTEEAAAEETTEEAAAEETAEETTDEVSDEETTVEEADTDVEQEVRGTPYTPSYTTEEAVEETAVEETAAEEAAVEEAAVEEAAVEAENSTKEDNKKEFSSIIKTIRDEGDEKNIAVSQECFSDKNNYKLAQDSYMDENSDTKTDILENGRIIIYEKYSTDNKYHASITLTPEDKHYKEVAEIIGADTEKIAEDFEIKYGPKSELDKVFRQMEEETNELEKSGKLEYSDSGIDNRISEAIIDSTSCEKAMPTFTDSNSGLKADLLDNGRIIIYAPSITEEKKDIITATAMPDDKHYDELCKIIGATVSYTETKEEQAEINNEMAKAKAAYIHAAMANAGADNSGLNDALRDLTDYDVMLIANAYKEAYGTELANDVKANKLSLTNADNIINIVNTYPADFDSAPRTNYTKNDVVSTYADAFNEATGARWGTDDKVVEGILNGSLSDEDIISIAAKLKEKGKNIYKLIEEDYSFSREKELINRLKELGIEE